MHGLVITFWIVQIFEDVGAWLSQQVCAPVVYYNKPRHFIEVKGHTSRLISNK